MEKVGNVNLVPPDGREEDGIPLQEHKDYQLVDSSGDGYVDHLAFDIREEPLPEGHTVTIEYTAEVDTNKRKKNKIMRVIRVISLIIIVGNFLVSGLTLGFGFPFLG